MKFFVGMKWLSLNLRRLWITDDAGERVEVRGGEKRLIGDAGVLFRPRNGREKRCLLGVVGGYVVFWGGGFWLFVELLPRLPQSGRWDASFTVGIMTLLGLGYVRFPGGLFHGAV